MLQLYLPKLSWLDRSILPTHFQHFLTQSPSFELVSSQLKVLAHHHSHRHKHLHLCLRRCSGLLQLCSHHPQVWMQSHPTPWWPSTCCSLNPFTATLQARFVPRCQTSGTWAWQRLELLALREAWSTSFTSGLSLMSVLLASLTSTASLSTQPYSRCHWELCTLESTQPYLAGRYLPYWLCLLSCNKLWLISISDQLLYWHHLEQLHWRMRAKLQRTLISLLGSPGHWRSQAVWSLSLAVDTWSFHPWSICY